MSIRVHSWFSTAALLAATFVLVAPACGEEPRTDHFARIISVEQMRQNRVGVSLNGHIADLEELIEDLKSNRLERDPGGEKLDAINSVLGALAAEHVPRARALLEQAGNEERDRVNSLKDAGVEIHTVVERLSELIDEAGIEQQRRMFTALLQEIAEGQWDLLHQTVAWGRAEMTATGDGGGAAFAERQYVVRGKLGVFLNQLRTAARDDATDKELVVILENTDKALTEGEVVGKQVAAAKALEAGDAARSAKAQQDALLALQKAIDILNGLESEELDRLLEQAAIKGKIREIIELEKGLRLDVLRLMQSELARDPGPYALRQRGITATLRELKPRVAAAFPTGMMATSVEMAAKEMEIAAKELDAPRKDPATEAQRHAIEILESALKTADEGGLLDSEYMALGLADFGGARAMASVLSIPYGLEEMLLNMNLMGVDMGMLMNVGASDSIGAGEGGLGAGTAVGSGSLPSLPGSGEGGDGGEGQGQGTGPAEVGESSEGFRWGSDMVGDEGAARGEQSLGHLERDRRKEVQQLFDEGLPPKFRAIVQDYFEVLAVGEE